MSYVLKAETKDETVYFQNIVCVTPQIEYAHKFPNYEEAEDNKGDFERSFYDDEAIISIVKIED